MPHILEGSLNTLACWVDFWKDGSEPAGRMIPSTRETAGGEFFPRELGAVISPSNRPVPLREKVAIYGEHGLEVWVVDPKKQEVKMHRQGEPVHSASLRQKSVLRWNGKAVPLSAIFQLS